MKPKLSEVLEGALERVKQEKESIDFGARPDRWSGLHQLEAIFRVAIANAEKDEGSPEHRRTIESVSFPPAELEVVDTMQRAPWDENKQFSQEEVDGMAAEFDGYLERSREDRALRAWLYHGGLRAVREMTA